MASDKLYWLDAAFERRVVLMSCSFPSFWARVGKEVDPECLNLDESRLAMRAAKLIATETNRPPESYILVLQRMRRQMEDGKVTYEECQAVGTFFLDAEDDEARHPMTEDAVSDQLAPLLRDRLAHKVVTTIMEEAGKGSTEEGELFPAAKKLIAKAETLGNAPAAIDVGEVLGEGSYDVMKATKNLDIMSTGIEDIDALLEGGQARGGLTIWLGATNAGKSMALVQRMGVGIRSGMLCALATLELTKDQQFARLKANLSGIPTNAILKDPDCVRGFLATAQGFGRAYVQTFTSYVTTVEDIIAWVTEIERIEGKPLDLLCIDYGDLVAPSKKIGREADSSNAVGRDVFSALRTYAEGEKRKGDGGHPGGPIWVDTACAAQRDPGTGKKRRALGTDDIGESLHKSKRATLMISINPTDDPTVSDFYIAKNSFGLARVLVSSIPSDFTTARIAPIPSSLEVR